MIEFITWRNATGRIHEKNSKIGYVLKVYGELDDIILDDVSELDDIWWIGRYFQIIGISGELDNISINKLGELDDVPLTYYVITTRTLIII